MDAVAMERKPDAESDVDRRARDVEAQMTDDERFSLIVSVMGVNTVNPVRDPRIPEGVPMSAGYTPGIPRLGVPSLRMSDASLGVTNPGYRRGDTASCSGKSRQSSTHPSESWKRAIGAAASRGACRGTQRLANNVPCSVPIR